MAILEESSEGHGKDGEAQPSKLLEHLTQEHMRRSPPHVLRLKLVSLISLLFFSFIYVVYSL